MEKVHCIICSKYRKFEKPKISYFLENTLVLSIISSKCKNEDEKIESIETIKIIDLIENIWLLLKYVWKKKSSRI